jgi:hypothetical protein
VLLAADRRYAVVSEPPNPYRAGVAGVHGGITRRCAGGSRQDLQPVAAGLPIVGGIGAGGLHPAGGVPYVETWATQGSDLLFVAHLGVPAYSLGACGNAGRTRFVRPGPRQWGNAGPPRGTAGTATARPPPRARPRSPTTATSSVRAGANPASQAGFHYRHLGVGVATATIFAATAAPTGLAARARGPASPLRIWAGRLSSAGSRRKRPNRRQRSWPETGDTRMC